MSILDDENILIQAATDSACYEMIDLGLSVKWANKNVGASHPEDTGLYFQWGDTVGYTADQVGVDKVFDWSTYKFGTYSNLAKYNSIDKLTVLESSDDAATVHMGSQYRTPTYDEIRELINNTTQTFIDLDGNEYSKEQAQNGAIEQGRLKGVRFTGSNGNNIFIPATGYCDGYLLIVNRMSGRLWFSDFRNGYDYDANGLYFGCGGMIYSDYYYRYYGFPVRGVE